MIFVVRFIVNRKGLSKYFKIFMELMIYACLLLMVLQSKCKVTLVYNTNTEISQLQQEIYEQSGVYTFYNVDVKDKKRLSSIFYNEDHHVTEQDALTSLKKIKEVLAIYSDGLPKEIYIIDSFNDRKMNCGGAFIQNKDIVILVNYHTDYLIEVIHHEIGHSIEEKSLDVKSLYKFATVQDSCKLVSNYACTNNDELFAETWSYAMHRSKTTNFSLAISDIFKKSIRFFDDPNYVEFYEFKDGLNQLINNEIDSFVIKKGPSFFLEKIKVEYPEISKVRFLAIGDELLFY